MARIKLIEPIVEEALINEPATRADNFLLYIAVLKKFIDTNMSLEAVFQNHVLLGIPSLESITRCRRKIQEEHPELRNIATEQIRLEEMEEYIEYSKE